MLLIAVLVTATSAAEELKRRFNLPSGDAAETLARFAAQADREIVFSPAAVRGVKTNSVNGEFTPREALDLLVARTSLVVSRDAGSGAIAVGKGPPSPNGASAAMSRAPSPTVEAVRNADDAIELSPFVITERSDTGWVATETLAGSRLRTNYKDVANQIETFTKDFMADLAVNSIEEAVVYSANIENVNDYIPFNSAFALQNPNDGPRVRGIGNGTPTRNFFLVSNPTDNFNLDRATFASGPNAILFGLGSPAGILDATPARAQMRNRYGVSFQYDSLDSKRTTIDLNQVVLKDRLSLRLMGLAKSHHTDKKPNLDRDDRIYGTLTFKPFKHTTIVLQGERDNRGWNRAIRMPPGDFVSPWLNADQIPGSGYTTPKPVYDNTNFAGIGQNVIFVRAANVPVLANDGLPMRSWVNSVTVVNPRSLPGVDPTYDAGAIRTVNDPAIFPFDVNVLGTSRTNVMGGIVKDAILEQRIAPDLHLELAYNYEKAYQHRLQAMGGGGGDFVHLFVDPNRYLPGTTTPNPHLGEYYYQGTASNIMQFTKNENWRATLSYEIDLARKLSERTRWAKWLGRHRFAGLYTESRQEFLNQGAFNRRILDDPVLTGLTLASRSTRNWAISPSRSPQFRHYLSNPHDTPTAPGSMTGDWMLTDSNNNPYTLYLYDTPFVSAESGKRLGAGQVASGSRPRTVSQLFAWQGYFLPDREQQSRLVLTYGYRRDTARSATLDTASTTQDFSGLYPNLWDVTFDPEGPAQTGINRNVGVVVRPLKWLSLFHNESSTFDLNIGRYGPFGNEYPGAGGDGRDYGIRLDLWNDRLSLRVNRYENTLGPRRASNEVNDPARNRIYNIEARVLELDPSLPTINVTDGNGKGYRTQGRPNYWIMSNYESSGYEVELNATPTPNWNIRMNGSKSEATESDIGSDWFEWVAQRLPVWQSVVAANGEVDPAGQPVTWATAPYDAANPTGVTLQEQYEQTLLRGSLPFITAIDGRATDTARPARANLITNYRFTEGKLRGFNVGGAARWRSAPIIGYATKPGAGTLPDIDLDRPYRGETELFFDAMFGYRGRMKAFGGFNYRLQLNIRNLLNERDPIPASATTTGEIVRIATVEPRVFVMTLALEF